MFASPLEKKRFIQEERNQSITTKTISTGLKGMPYKLLYQSRVEWKQR